MASIDEGLKVGTSIVSHLSEAFYGDSARVFEEYICNASDALASEVKIVITPSFIEINDDGEGMTPEQLRKFFFIAHSDKKPGEYKEGRAGKGRKNIRRQIIGQFGLGKLSAYKFADKISIRTWRDKVESEASLSFSELMKKRFIEDFTLNVSSRKITTSDSGTVVEMSGLKKEIYPKSITRKLSKHLSVRPDLIVEINGERLENEKYAGKVVPIHENHPTLGRIEGKLIYTDEPIYGESGVYIRVYGRVVNANPRLLRDMSKVVSSNSLSQRTVIDVNIDSMADAVLAHRNGFNEEHPLFDALCLWVRKFLNKENADYMEERSGESDKIQEAVIISTVKNRLSNTIPKEKKSLVGRTRITNRKAMLKEAEKVLDNKERVALSFEGTDFFLSLKPNGAEAPEWLFYGETNTVAINTDHPLFREAKRRRAQDIYSLKTIIVAIAVQSSKNLEEFKRKYEALTRIAAKSAK